MHPSRLQNLCHILSHGSPSLHPACQITVLHCSAEELSSSGSSSLAKTAESPLEDGCRFILQPEISLFDQPVKIQVVGLPVHAPVTLQGWSHTLWRGRELLLVSYGHFYTDQQGSLDLDQDPSLAGTYTGVDGMGLFWSLGPLPGHPQGVRFVIRDVTKPLIISLAVFHGHITPDEDTVAMVSVKPLALIAAERRFLASGVKRILVRQGRIRGTLFLPSGEGKHPGVIDMFGGAGGLMEMRAALFAAHGFAALALAFFRFEDLPREMEDVQFDYVEEAAEWLAEHGSVKSGGIGVVGTSRGGSMALLMAYMCPQVKAVVNITGNPFPGYYCFMRHGQIFFKSTKLDATKMTFEEEAVSTKDCYVVTDADFFPVWQSQAHILCIAGEDDQQVAWQQIVRLRDLYPAHQRHLIDVVVYPGAGHLLEPPNSPLCNRCEMQSAGGNMVLWGGEPKAHAVAQRDAWRRILEFLNKWL